MPGNNPLGKRGGRTLLTGGKALTQADVNKALVEFP